MVWKKLVIAIVMALVVEVSTYFARKKLEKMSAKKEESKKAETAPRS